MILIFLDAMMYFVLTFCLNSQGGDCTMEFGNDHANHGRDSYCVVLAGMIYIYYKVHFRLWMQIIPDDSVTVVVCVYV